MELFFFFVAFDFAQATEKKKAGTLRQAQDKLQAD
ncbi:hypothetical protein CRDW_33680 [Chryseobacterium gambrini]|jgi:hypothetical protein|uniref:Uncharacterized protein n=1 Tax=Chryseobacterium gambrini TaxID=373672 RepID=A0ABM8KAD1_9FLAO|nr:hypothetical protein CRDW_33680 [Chryseobacterium gambrini]